MAKSAKKSQLNAFNRGVPYSRGANRFYNRFGTSELVVQHEYREQDHNAIQIVLDFYSDQGEWIGPDSRIGDFLIENIQDNSPEIRFESKEEDTTFELSYSVPSSNINGFFPSVIFLGNHNLTEDDYITLSAYSDSGFTDLRYETTFKATEVETYLINFNKYQKLGYYKLTIELDEARVLKLGRVVLGSSLPTTYENNMQESFSTSYKHYKDEVVTEYLSRVANTLGWVRNMSFDIQLKQDDDSRLNDRLQDLIREGNGNRVFIVIPDPRNPQLDSIYGVLVNPSEFTQKYTDQGIYSFEVEEVK